mmetsp:Transcript_1096/g.1440  ORF Transcript_1096/g.1440 Transcript_1096/m.1440 type:complete len:472 (+) Transcript_1096:227-1642(+)|eukprot:CAMPEP_0204878316 /NCGR_PEP_ID=MMETSP1348-20121228/48683_1 /ASSEMBLY_ACC=CAM_ASM_000700 /TAXON_ID=215587 /ORGANISM="Aplanochytrium stocchinoi, Strain GSBS06" /LENGTH=471 /DNA_ID=CAMNT_0052035291 /DNA_START=101 /DNA_END=1516 /DNA_ORIENTATION=-
MVEKGIVQCSEVKNTDENLKQTQREEVGDMEIDFEAKSQNTTESFRRKQRSVLLWSKYQGQVRAPPSKPFGGRTEKLLLRAKRHHRTDINYRDWGKYEYYKRWDELKQKLIEGSRQNVEKIFGPDYDMKRFQEEFEYPNKPCLISGLCDNWLARETWDYDRLREKYGERHFKCGEDDDGYSIKIKLKHFFRYQNSSEPGGAKLDDSPLYIFEPNFDDDKILKSVLNDYSVPHLFQEDLFALVGEKTRPPYRWILFGPERSGSCVHIDPLGSSAWNALIRGRKLWVIFPPELKKRVVKGKDHINHEVEDDEAIDWFVNILPRILKHGGESLSKKMISFLQRPGETVFVPTNWWHAVLNLDDTVAITQNFCSSGNFDAVWRHTRTGRTRMAGTWLKMLKMTRPDLYERALELDKTDGFDFSDVLNKAIAKRQAKKEKKVQKKLKRQQAREQNATDNNKMDISSSSSSESSDSD